MTINKRRKLTIVNHGEEQWLEIYNGEELLLKLTSSQYYLTEEAVAETLRMLGYLVEIDNIDF